MELDKNKTKQLLEKAKVFTGEMLQTHDTKQEQSNSRNKMKRLLDTTNPSKNYVVCVFEF
jgi:hypothetical protein